jgi:hypothetical protein
MIFICFYIFIVYKQMRKTKKNMKFKNKNKNKNYYKRYSNNRAYINRRLPLLAKAGMIANRSSPTRVPEGLSVPRSIQPPARSDVFGYKYVTPRDPPPPDDPFHQDHRHWQYLDKGTDYLEYNETDPILLERKFKQMAFKVYQHYDLDRKLRAYAFDAGYKFGIDDTSSFETKSRAALNLEHKINIDKYNQELYATERRLLNYPEFEVYKQQHPTAASRVIKLTFGAGYNYAKKEAFMPSSILRSTLGGPHVTQVYEHSAAKRTASLPQDFKTYKQILFEILAKARNDRLAAQAAATMRAYNDARAKTRRSTIKTALLSSLLGAAALAHSAHLYMGTNYQPQPQPPQAHMSFPSRMQQSLADLTRRGRGKKNTRRRRKNRK